MTVLVLSLVFLGSLFLVIGGFVFLNRRRLASTDAARIRVGEVGGILRGQLPASILRDERVSEIKALNELLSGRGFTVQLEKELARAGSRQRPGEFMMLTVLGGMIGLTLMSFMVGGLLSVIGLFMGALVPWALLMRAQGKRRSKFESQLPDALDLLTNSLKAGYSLQAAMEFVGKESLAPLGPELIRFYDEQRLGIDVRTALVAMQERIGTDDARMFVTALLLQRETGGNLGELLTSISNIIRQRLQFRGQLATLTAEPRASARVLAAMPFVMFGVLYAMNPEYMQPLLTTPSGKFAIVYAVTSVAFGYFVMTRIANVEM
ncbi:MAG: type II secretion system F family protein [Gemmatimonadota bacterium]